MINVISFFIASTQFNSFPYCIYSGRHSRESGNPLAFFKALIQNGFPIEAFGNDWLVLYGLLVFVRDLSIYAVFYLAFWPDFHYSHIRQEAIFS